MTPHEFVSPFNHTLEEILILPCSKFWPEGLFTSIQNASLEQHVSCSTLSPINDQTGLVGRPIVESSFDDPLRWLMFEAGLYGPQCTFHLIRLASFEQGEKPILNCKLVIVDKCNKLTFRVLQSVVSSQSNVLARFNAVYHLDRRSLGKLVYDLSC